MKEEKFEENKSMREKVCKGRLNQRKKREKSLKKDKGERKCKIMKQGKVIFL